MKIALLGDVALFGINTLANKEYRNKFRVIKMALSNYDYVIANLETPLTTYNGTVGGKSAYIKGAPKDVEILKYLGITHVSLANNHMFDYKQEGINDTINVLDKHKIEWFGIKGKTIDIVDNTNRLRLHGYCCYSTNAKGLSTIIDVLDPFKIEKDIEHDLKERYLPILSCHWGQEHIHYPNYDHVKVSRKLSKKGKVIIVGHHPHVLQGIETINEALVAYSLGNFCFDDVYTSKSSKPLIKLSDANKESVILGLEIKDNIIINREIETFTFDKIQYASNPKIKHKIEIWSRFLDTEEADYIKIRDKELDSYLNERKKQRDIEWYFKRLNLESAKIILSGKYNSKRYKSLVKKYIS